MNYVQISHVPDANTSNPSHIGSSECDAARCFRLSPAADCRGHARSLVAGRAWSCAACPVTVRRDGRLVLQRHRSRSRRSASARASGCGSRSTTALPKKRPCTGTACACRTPWTACRTLLRSRSEPGERFVYEFDAVDAGTFWYHPHQRSFEQVGRGLYGPLIVEEPEPVRVDRDVTWVLGDWRLTKSGAISEDFGNRHDIHHNGRVGNTVTINGRVPDSFAVRKGERIRLRLINAANARIFSLDFAGHEPIVIALDGQPVTPHAPDGGRVVLGPAMRVDLIIDMTGDARQPSFGHGSVL